LIGETLSHYRVTAALGTGGMGAVYRATDTRLGREVAIKVLPPEVAEDPERLSRFRREAHLLAALNHPNIAAIYGLEEADGKPFLALELVEGEDLKERLAQGPIPVDEALEIAEQVAEALEEAHNKGIVHRDLKPANVKLTPEGKVKVLDFGLAKAWAGDTSAGGPPSSAVSQSPTLTRTGTTAGVILGTAAYMSPEQARGKPVDKRADVWSFGVLLWEMLTGRALFAGDTVTDVIAAVVAKEIDLGAVPEATPLAVRLLLSRCLRRDPRSRLPDMGAARLELQDVRTGVAGPTEGGAPREEEGARIARRGRSRERWIWATVLAAAGLAWLVTDRQMRSAPKPLPASHFVLDTADLAFGEDNPLAVSPDGGVVAFAAFSAGSLTQLWLRPLDSPEVRPLPGTEGAQQPFWSPDSQSIGFAAGGEIRRVALSTTTVQRVCRLPEGGFSGGTWNSAGTIVFSAGGNGALLYSVPATGGQAKPVTSHDEARSEAADWAPQFLPDGHHLLFSVEATREESAGLYVTALEAAGGRQRVRPEVGRFKYVDPGYLLFVQNGSLLAQPFDARRRVTTGQALPVASSVGGWSAVPGWGWFSASATGRVAWLSKQATDFRLEWLDRKGTRLGTLGGPAKYAQVVLSPDDRRVAAEIADADNRYDLWLIDVARGVPTRLTTDPANDRDPVWSPDGDKLVYSSDARGDPNLLLRDLRSSSPAAPLPRGIGQTPGDQDSAKDWLREGNTLLYLVIGADQAAWAASLDGQGPPEPLLKGFAVDNPRVSPDGRLLAYISTESGEFEVYIQPFRQSGERVRVSVGGGGQPRWRADGRELFYLSRDADLMAVTVREGPRGLEVGMPATLVAAQDLRAVVEGPDYSDYAVTSDGQRFLVKRAEENRQQRIHVLLDWPSLLR
jgi:Tol biopolymer transport system component